MNKLLPTIMILISLTGCSLTPLSVCDMRASASPNTKEVWCKEFQLKGWETAEDSIFSQNNIYVAGMSQRSGFYGISGEALLLSFSEYGEINRKNTFTFFVNNPDDGNTTANGMTLLKNGHLLLAGMTQDENAFLEGWIATFDSSGDIINKRTTKDDKWFDDVASTNGPGFVAVGGGRTGGIVKKYSDLDHILWTKNFPFNPYIENTRWSSVVTTMEGNIVVAGDDALKGLVVMKLNSSGDMIWRKNYGKTSADAHPTIKVTTNKTFIISTQYKGKKLWVLNINNTGDLIWEKKLGKEAWSNDILSIGSHGYMVCGTKISSKGGRSKAKAWMIHLNISGDVVSEKFIGGTGFSSCSSIAGNEETLFIIGKTVGTRAKSRNFAWGKESFSTIWILRENTISESLK